MDPVNNTKKITFGGMMVVLTLLALYATTLLPFNKLLLLALSSLIVAIMVIHYGKKQALLVYIASAFLSFIIVPNKGIALAYVLFFGYYGILKSLIEGIHNLVIEWILKLLCFSIAMMVIYFLASQLFFEGIISTLPLWALIIALEVLFILYDYFFSRVIQYYNQRRK